MDRHRSQTPLPGGRPAADGGPSPARILGVGLAALAAVYVGAWLVLRGDGGPQPAAAPPPDPGVAVEGAPGAAGAVPSAPRAGAPEPAASERVPAPRAEEGTPMPAHPERTGLDVFPPMGSKPIQRGILVPDDFELPPGFVRHRQATDDGTLLPAILKFHPDYAPVDRNGNTVDPPPDGVVPPELAPPGLPIRFLEPPPPRGERDEDRDR